MPALPISQRNRHANSLPGTFRPLEKRANIFDSMEALGSQTNLFSEYMENQNRKKSKIKNVLKADET